MERYNIALLPTDSTLQDNIIRISRDYFFDIHDEYILGPDGLPHITLCQFKAINLEDAKAVYNDLLSSEKSNLIDLVIEKFNARSGSLANAGKFIAEYQIRPDKDLMALQLRCSKKLAEYRIQSLTPSKTYSPHITLARLTDMPNTLPSGKDLDCPLAITGSLSLGLSTEEGVFVKELQE